MRDKGNIYIHIIVAESGQMLSKNIVSMVPSVGDEMRLGGKENEQYYKVNRVVWVYDEPESPWERANVGVDMIKGDDDE